MPEYCDTYWGSHGCDLSLGHEGLHICGDCSEFEFLVPPGLEDFDTGQGRVRYQYEDESWSGWFDTTGFRMHAVGL
jgi:hypothetical protein